MHVANSEAGPAFATGPSLPPVLRRSSVCCSPQSCWWLKPPR